MMNRDKQHKRVKDQKSILKVCTSCSTHDVSNVHTRLIAPLTNRRKHYVLSCRERSTAGVVDVGGARLQPCLPAGRRFRRRQGGVCFESGPEREDSPGKMATAGSAERPGRPTRTAAGRYRSGPGAGSGSCPPENEVKKCSVCIEGQPGSSPPCGHPACPLCRAQRQSGTEERLRRRSDPERSSSRPGRRDCDSRRGWCVYRGNYRSPPLAASFTNQPQKNTDATRVKLYSNFTVQD